MKKYISFILIAILTFSLSAPVYASATPSNASLDDYLANYEKIPLPVDNPGLGVVEEWEGDDGNLVASDSDWDFEAPILGSPIYVSPGLLASADTSISNTISDRRNVGLRVFYVYDGTETNRTEDKFCDSSGYANISLSNSTGPYKVGVYLNNSGLPSPGKYYMSCYFASNTGGFTYSNPRVVFRKDNSNATNSFGDNVSIPSNKFSQTSGDFRVKDVVVEITSATSALFVELDVKGLKFPYGGYITFQFRPAYDASVDVPGQEFSQDEYNDKVMNDVGNISSGVSDVNNTLQEIVETISKQLEALWNQMYNYIHLEDMANADKNADKIVNALGNEISVQIENDDRISEDIMANDDKNTDTIVNGYDGSCIESDNDRLNSSINEYEEAESQVLDKVNDELGGFEFSDSIDGYVSAVSLISGFIQDIYDNSGGFKDVINIGFFLSIASIVIGMYRFKEG